MREAQDKRERGEPLTEHEWTILQYALGGGCQVCGGMKIAVAERKAGRGR